ncbi:MAG TPA: ChbG/HpnK family deacetylase [Vicinamibacterales bacterium]|nr:ChbG/HpnK family deacetylase [Vicinamibacterales bacterium]
MLIVTADDYGRDRRATDAILRCGAAGRITAASAMVFMGDSTRAASLAGGSSIEFGLHLNFTEPLDEAGAPASLRRDHTRTRAYLTRRRLAPALYSPRLRRAFASLVEAQRGEFERLYGRSPAFFNGHHHMHLCSNVLLEGLMPPGACVRNSFTFEAGEKSLFNRAYRGLVSRWVRARYTSTDAFFSIAPIGDLDRLRRLVRRSEHEAVELETHPEDPSESAFLLGSVYAELLASARSGGFRDLPLRGAAARTPTERRARPEPRA